VKAILVLEDGITFEGEAIGAPGTVVGEVVFNTGMTGYQEILTDPSYAGQIVTLTYPLIGNYGINEEDDESRRIQVSALVVREACEHPSNWRARWTLREHLRAKGVPGIHRIDTRALTRRLRAAGVMMGILTTELTREEAWQHLKASPRYEEFNYVRMVTTPEPYVWDAEGMKPCDAPELPDTRYRLTLVDCG
jgi:carbamoyl-phosphate synthase small subunit